MTIFIYLPDLFSSSGSRGSQGRVSTSSDNGNERSLASEEDDNSSQRSYSTASPTPVTSGVLSGHSSSSAGNFVSSKTSKLYVVLNFKF